MRSKPFWQVGIAATLLVTACSSTPSTSPSPLPEYQPPQGMNSDIRDTLPETMLPTPVPTQIPIVTATPTADTPACPAQISDQGLADPQGIVMNPYQIGNNLPVCIPQQYANQCLQALDGPLMNPYQANYTPYEGVQNGCSPDLMSYGALSRCLYYPYYNYYVPYILVGSSYYPYGYASCYNYAGWYEYPWLYNYNDSYYPYSYMSRSYSYGYMDSEYNWPSYRERYQHNYDEDYSRYSRRHNQDFSSWRDGQVNREVADEGSGGDRINQYFERFQKNHSDQIRNRGKDRKQGKAYRRDNVVENDTISPPKQDQVEKGDRRSKNSDKVEKQRHSKDSSTISDGDRQKNIGNDSRNSTRVGKQKRSKDSADAKDSIKSKSDNRSKVKNDRKHSSTSEDRKGRKGQRNVHGEEDVTDENQSDSES